MAFWAAAVAGGDQGAGQVGDQPGVALLVAGHVLPVGHQGQGIAGPLAQAFLVGAALDRLGELGRERLDLDQLAHQRTASPQLPVAWAVRRARRRAAMWRCPPACSSAMRSALVETAPSTASLASVIRRATRISPSCSAALPSQ
jgi:hypothetical protein